MLLNDAEKRILNGDSGDTARRCMEFLVAYGDAAGAEYLVDIDGTVDIHPGLRTSWVTDYQFTVEEIAQLAAQGETFRVPTFSSKPIVPGFVVDNWQNCCMEPSCDPAFHEQCMERIAPLIKMGMIPTLSCDAYLTASFLPTVGQHCAWVESSAIPWANAILGARSNHDGCFQAAYLGKIPAYDMHLDENRKATVLVTCGAKLTRDMDYDLFGWAAGEALGLRVPAFTGLGKPTASQLVKMNSALNTSGQVRMYHIPGLTPEAPTLESAAAANRWEEVINVTKSDLRRVYDMLNYANNSQVDFVYLGCPHYNIREVQTVARLLENKRCAAELWVMTSPGVYAMAVQMGCAAAIEKAGGKLLSGSCPGVLGGVLPNCSVMATDASKQNYYITGHVYPKKLEVWYGTTEDCVDAAVTGVWRGDWR